MDPIFITLAPSLFLSPNSAYATFQYVKVVLKSPTAGIPVSGSPPSPWVQSSLAGLPGLGLESLSELRYSIVTGQSRVSQGKRHMVKVREEPDPSPPTGVPWHALHSPSGEL